MASQIYLSRLLRKYTSIIGFYTSLLSNTVEWRFGFPSRQNRSIVFAEIRFIITANRQRTKSNQVSGWIFDVCLSVVLAVTRPLVTTEWPSKIAEEFSIANNGRLCLILLLPRHFHLHFNARTLSPLCPTSYFSFPRELLTLSLNPYLCTVLYRLFPHKKNVYFLWGFSKHLANTFPLV